MGSMSNSKSGVAKLLHKLLKAIRIIIAVFLFVFALIFFSQSLKVSGFLFVLTAAVIFPATGNLLTTKLPVPKYAAIGLAIILFLSAIVSMAIFPAPDEKLVAVEQKDLDIDHVDKPESIESDEDYEKRMEAVRAEAKAKYDAIVAKNIEESEKSKNQKPSKSTINSTNPNQPYSRGTGRSFIRESLKDSGSAKFRNDFISSSSAYCGELNAKNSFGAYVGFQRFIVINGVAAFETARNTNDFSNLWNSDCKK